MKRTKIFISILLILLVLGDIITTKVVLQSELVFEGNPFARFLIENNIFVILKLSSMIFILYFIHTVDKLTFIEIGSICTVCLVSLFAVINNLIKIITIF